MGRPPVHSPLLSAKLLCTPLIHVAPQEEVRLGIGCSKWAVLFMEAVAFLRGIKLWELFSELQSQFGWEWGGGWSTTPITATGSKSAIA